MNLTTPRNESAATNYALRCATRELETDYIKAVYIYLAPPIIVCGLASNLLSIVVYSHAILRGSTTVRFLTVKAVASLLFLLCFAHMSVYHAKYGYKGWNVFAAGNRTHSPDDVADFYWLSLTWTMFLSNVFSTVTVWVSVAVTAEHYAMVVWPVHFRDKFTLLRSNTFSGVTIALSALMHSYYVVALTVTDKRCSPDQPPPVNDTDDESRSTADKPYIKYYFNARPSVPPALHQVYFVSRAGLTVVIPLGLMVFFSFWLYVKLVRTGKFKQTRNEQKRLIISLAVATAGCHLVFEFPHLLVLMAAAFGMADRKEWTLEPYKVLNAVAATFSMVHAAVPFFTYIWLSRRFTEIFVHVCLPCLHWPWPPPGVDETRTTGGRPSTLRNRITGVQSAYYSELKQSTREDEHANGGGERRPRMRTTFSKQDMCLVQNDISYQEDNGLLAVPAPFRPRARSMENSIEPNSVAHL